MSCESIFWTDISQTEYSRTVADVAVAAYNDRVDTQNGTSLCGLAAKYEVAAEHVIAGKGNYSPYNTANLTMIKAYADKKAS